MTLQYALSVSLSSDRIPLNSAFLRLRSTLCLLGLPHE